MTTGERIRVWDPWVRLTHWAIVLLLPFSWWTAETERFRLHFLSGYAILALVLFRIAWGFVGSETARFARFVRGPAAALRHLSELRRRQVPVEIGHSAAGGWMVLLLLGMLLVQAAAGLFADNEVFTRGPLARRVDAAWSDLATSVHLRVFWVIVAAVALHVAAVVGYRALLGRNLVPAMITGRMAVPPGVSLRPPRLAGWLSGAALLAVSAAAVWWVASFGPLPRL